MEPITDSLLLSWSLILYKMLDNCILDMSRVGSSPGLVKACAESNTASASGALRASGELGPGVRVVCFLACLLFCLIACLFGWLSLDLGDGVVVDSNSGKPHRGVLSSEMVFGRERLRSGKYANLLSSYWSELWFEIWYYRRRSYVPSKEPGMMIPLKMSKGIVSHGCFLSLARGQ